jgi:hypothetical protein
VEFFDGSFVDEAGADRLPSAGEPRHEMALDKARGDPEIGPEKGAVHEDVAAGRTLPDEGQRGLIFAVVVDDRVIPENIPAEHLRPFVGGARPVHAVADDDRDVFPGNPRRLQAVQQRPEKAVFPAVGDGACDVGDGHRRGKLRGRFPLAPDDLRKRRAADGMREGLFKGGPRVLDDRNFFHTDNRAVRRNADLQDFRPVFDGNLFPVRGVDLLRGFMDVGLHIGLRIKVRFLLNLSGSYSPKLASNGGKLLTGDTPQLAAGRFIFKC